MIRLLIAWRVCCRLCFGSGVGFSYCFFWGGGIMLVVGDGVECDGDVRCEMTTMMMMTIPMMPLR